MRSDRRIFLWNVVQSWLEGPRVADGDPWDLDEYDQRTHEWRWFERRRETAIAAGGDHHGETSDERLATDGGTHDDRSGHGR